MATRIGFKLMAETFDPKEIVRQAVAAERAGFDFVEISDHYHPWLYSHKHSGFAWSMLAAIAVQTETLGLATGVTCPFIRYHPAIIAQAAATTALLSDGRFTLGLGSGERLNEHVTGATWPSAHIRHEMLREAIEVIRLLWSGGYHTYQGTHITLDDARVFDLPDELPEIVVAAGGTNAAEIAGRSGDGLFTTEPDADLIAAYRDAGGTGARYTEVPMSWADDVDTAVASAHEKFRFGLTGWKVQSELPNPINFEAATSLVRPSDVADAMSCGPDIDAHVASAKEFADAGFDHLTLLNAGPDVDAFLAVCESDLIGKIRSVAG
ncbi:TIGR03557 family F420-dependent LLM class oxidoreductase [Williamsia herbipolensis]|uniref:TIGR03557 family F420-dependent LLM class oxidoreductase n=1 Tax=Williamsia herbipolensis TaxID=1603258 RepID=A0AAU4K619_9NOCA|nr:TIGR03557 family F420-dependent LLM class oxidoreductase [Williamsia herbipolensis]